MQTSEATLEEIPTKPDPDPEEAQSTPSTAVVVPAEAPTAAEEAVEARPAASRMNHH